MSEPSNERVPNRMSDDVSLGLDRVVQRMPLAIKREIRQHYDNEIAILALLKVQERHEDGICRCAAILRYWKLCVLGLIPVD